jgi:predicted porin
MGTLLRRVVIGLLAITGFSVAADAADLGDTVKALPQIPDTLTWQGITLYGTIDVGYGYATTGAKVGGSYWGLNPQVLAAPAGQKPVSTLNTLGLSGIGLKIEENIGSGWQVIGSLKTGFDPLTGKLDDMCATRIQQNGLSASQQTVNGNGTRCGQAFNGEAWGGLKSDTYGTLTAGRIISLGGDVDWNYDPQSTMWNLSYLQFLGGGIPSFGYRWDNSVKYAYQYGPFHAQVMYAQGAQASNLHGDSYAADIGATSNGVSVDGIYQKMTDVVSDSTFGVGACGTVTTPSCSTLKVTAQDIELWGIMGKYTYDLAGHGPGGKLTFYAGFQHANYSDPSNPLSVGDTIAGGYTVGLVNNTAYLYGSQSQHTAWIGAKYETGPWTVSVAYYLENQAFYKTSPASTPCSTNVSFNCSGATNTASGSVIYAVNKHLEVYSGVVWSQLSGGLTVGYATPYQTTGLTGLIFRF